MDPYTVAGYTIMGSVVFLGVMVYIYRTLFPHEEPAETTAETSKIVNQEIPVCEWVPIYQAVDTV